MMWSIWCWCILPV